MEWFRQARPAAPSWNLLKTLLQIVAFWGVFLFVVPSWLVAIAAHFGIPAHPSSAGRITGATVFLLASALGLASALTIVRRGGGTPLPLDGPRHLVVRGPYAWVRNPMAVAGLAQGLGVAMWHGSWVIAVYVITGGVLWHRFIRPIEEADLERTFGDEFRRYRRQVALWWPERGGHDSQ